MSSPQQESTAQTPATGTRRRYLGATRRKRTSEIPLLSPDPSSAVGTDVTKQQGPQGSNPTVHVDDNNSLNKRIISKPGDGGTELHVQGEASGERNRPYSELPDVNPRTPTCIVTPNRRGLLLKSGNLRSSQKNLVMTDGTVALSSSSSLSSTPHLLSTPINRLSLRNARKRFKPDDFKSPMRNQVQEKSTETAESVSQDIETLRQTLKELESEITALTNEGYCEDELQTHIEKMHEYNELKDTGQMLLGKIALMEGVTTKDLYARFGLGLDD